MLNSSTHECHAEGCPVQIANHLAFCPAHWRMVPRDLQGEIIETYRIRDRRGWYQAIRRAQALITEEERYSLVPKTNTPLKPPVATALIIGNTFPVKEQLKALGGVWDRDAKGWRVPLHQKMAAEVLVANASEPETRRLPSGTTEPLEPDYSDEYQGEMISRYSR